MELEKSCGAVLFTRQGGRRLFVIVTERSGSCSFPKGHMEDGETEMETARREILEETGLQVDFLPGFREQDAYDLREKPGTRKEVVYFLAEFTAAPCLSRPEEIRGIRLLPYEEARACFPWAGSRRVLDAAKAYLDRE